MKRVTINLAGAERHLALSNRVLIAIGEKFGGIEKLGDAVSGENATDALKNTCWLLAEMMEAGHKDCLKHGIEDAEPMSYDDILDECDFNDIASMKDKIFEAVHKTAEPSIETEEPKNAIATQGR